MSAPVVERGLVSERALASEPALVSERALVSKWVLASVPVLASPRVSAYAPVSACVLTVDSPSARVFAQLAPWATHLAQAEGGQHQSQRSHSRTRRFRIG